MDVGAYEAKTHLPKLLERAAKGERITITKHGVPVAILIPATQGTRPLAQTVDALKAFRSRHTLGDLALREMIETGRK